MSEHRIRLRGGWQCLVLAVDAPDDLRRIDLPLGSISELPPRCRLIRQFGRPPFDPTVERVSLEFSHAPGVVSARLNGSTIGVGLDFGSGADIPIDAPILARNGLALDVDRSGLGPDPGEPWGRIALVIRAR